MASFGWALLLFLAQLLTLNTYGVHANGDLTPDSAPIRCHPDQAKALLKLKQSFFLYSTTTLPSWLPRTDCCLWEGVGCSNSSGHVTVLDLGGSRIFSHGLDPVVFNLSSLRILDLSMNHFKFEIYSMPVVGFEKLTLLTHLNLSNSGFRGQIPVGIGKLVNLISLDLSNRFGTLTDDDYNSFGSRPNWFVLSNFQTLVGNLSDLRELYLDDVHIYSSTNEWCSALAKCVPYLQVLSLEDCNLYGPIHQSLSSLRSLTVINLGYNYGISAGPFPEFFMDFVNLSVLQLAAINLEGWFPQRIFQSKNLRVLDLSGNTNLSGNLPTFSNANSLETLRLDWTNFSYAKPSPSSNFKSLKELSLGGREISSIFQWIGDLKNLTSLELQGCDFTSTVPSTIANLKNLTSLSIIFCNLTMPVLSAIDNLKGLQILYIFGCRLHGSMPLAIGNLTNLRSLKIYYSDFSGPIPSTIGNLINLNMLDIYDCLLSGLIPYTVGQLKELTTLRLRESSFARGIPNSIGNLTRLLHLDLSSNYLNGEIPTSLFTLLALQDLHLDGNQLSGPIPEFDVASSCLVYVDLSMNELTGKIPRSLFELTNLRYLSIASNNLVGSVDLTSFWRLTKLNNLDLSNNKLSVTDGEGNYSSSTYPLGLNVLGLVCCNITKFPSILTRLNDVSSLDLSCNKLGGDIPNWIWERWNSSLKYLNLNGKNGSLSLQELRGLDLKVEDCGSICFRGSQASYIRL